LKSMRLWKLLSLLPVPALLAAIMSLYALHFNPTLSASGLHGPISTATVVIPTLIVAYVSFRSFLVDGAWTILMLGTAVFTISVSILVALALIVGGRIDYALLTHNAGLILSGALHLASALLSMTGVRRSDGNSRRWHAASAYVAILFFFLTTAVLAYWITPTVFVWEGSALLLGQGTPASIVVMFALASALFMRRYLIDRKVLQWWYSLALALIAVGVLPYALGARVLSILSVVGDMAGYFSGVYFIVTVLIATKRIRLE